MTGAFYVIHHTFEQLGIRLVGTPAARELLAPMMILREVEMPAVAYCGEFCDLLGLTCYPGTTTHVEFPFRSILVEAVTMNARGMVIAHNHPSGIALPSQDDIAATRRLIMASEAIGVTLLDHLVFAGESCFSFRQKGLM